MTRSLRIAALPQASRTLRTLAAGVALAMALGTAGAQSLDLLPPAVPAVAGQAFELPLTMSFTGQPTLGGGVDLLYDPARLQFTGFVFGAALADDPGFRRLPDLEDGRLVGLAFGHFNGLAGPAEVGRYGFIALLPGETALSLQPNTVPAGDFISLQTFGPQSVQFGAIELTIGAVPEPASAALLPLGLALLGWARRSAARRRSPKADSAPARSSAALRRWASSRETASTGGFIRAA